jgi:hypothetical protein
MPWNNYQGFRVYAQTVNYTNIIAFNIIIQSKFPQKNGFFILFSPNSVEKINF